MTATTAWAIKAKNVCEYLIFFELMFLSMMYGISEIYTRTGIQGFIFLILWAMAGKVLLWVTDRDRCVRVRVEEIENTAAKEA